MNAIQTTHNLDFEVSPSPYTMPGLPQELYRVGTCGGQWFYTKDGFHILSFLNHEPGNGHLNDVFEWFEFSSKRDNVNLIVLECMNERFYQHLINKRGFVPLDQEKRNVIKVFNKKLFRKMKR